MQTAKVEGRPELLLLYCFITIRLQPTVPELCWAGTKYVLNEYQIIIKKGKNLSVE